MDFGQHLKSVRTRCGLTQEELARRSGVGQTTLSAVERGARSPTLDTLDMLAHGLGVTISELLYDGFSQNDGDALTPEERRLIANFRDLNSEGKSMVVNMVSSLALSPATQKSDQLSMEAS